MHRLATTAALAATVAAGLVFAPAVHASNVAWSVSVGVPGLAITAGQPAGWGFGAVAAPFHRPYFAPFAPAFVAPPVVFAAPVVYRAPVVVPAPAVVWAPVVRVPRVVVAAPVVRGAPYVYRAPIAAAPAYRAPQPIAPVAPAPRAGLNYASY